ncbi:hypothetical protein Barb4_05578 [Bacteroidales bacterium Barb4]|nr:hypothetical protein Barb4_05578 [Bacteroidales bacterium Barb4]
MSGTRTLSRPGVLMFISVALMRSPGALMKKTPRFVPVPAILILLPAMCMSCPRVRNSSISLV